LVHRDECIVINTEFGDTRRETSARKLRAGATSIIEGDC
jgi:hypothetical protein